MKPNHALQVVEEIVNHTANEALTQLVQMIEGIPLAITLIARLIRHKTEKVHSLLRKVHREQTRVIERGDSQLDNLKLSISLSIKSSHMTEQPQAKLLLYLIASLPVGLPLSMQENIESYIPQFQSLLTTLRGVALVQINPEVDSP